MKTPSFPFDLLDLEETPTSDSDDKELKFNLYLRVHEAKQITDSLQHILLLPTPERDQWLKDHEALVTNLMESFMDDSVMAMDGMYLDGESQELSVELISTLRDAMNIIRSISDQDDSDTSLVS